VPYASGTDFLFRFIKYQTPMSYLGKKRSTVKKRNRTVKKFIKDLDDLEKLELSGQNDSHSSTALSDTDEDENEGLGDGKMGRDVHDLFGK
jgi:hypothetical protein